MFLKTFEQLDKQSVAIAGGKGASLGEMTQAKIPVPRGFVVLATAFDRFIEETDLNVEIEATIRKLHHHDIESVEKASEKIRDMIGDTKFPQDIGIEIQKQFDGLKAPLVAVRSSATAEDSSVASWAGELESYLNVQKAGLLTAVKKCWSSLFTPRAIFYRFEKKLADSEVSVAVVVQKMIQSEVSGITFTVHPVTEDKSQMVIEAGFGLGEAIVGGKITPDTYIVDKSKTGRSCIVDKNISEQSMMISRSPKGTKEMPVPIPKRARQKLTDARIVEIRGLCARIETHYGFPCDIEWAYQTKKFYIVQSRPITALK